MDGPGDGDEAAEAPPPLTRKGLLAQVQARVGPSARADARAGAEAALAIVAEALAGGRDLQLPPLGRVRVVRRKDTPRALVLTLRLVRPRRAGAGGEAEADAGGALADPGEPV